MKNETKGIAPLILAIVVIVVVAVAGVGVFVATRGGGTDGGGGDGTGGDVGSATSLSFDITETSTGSAFTYKAKDIGSSNMKMRIEGTVSSYDIIYIINGATQTMWMYASGTWFDMSSSYSTYWDTYSTMLSGYQTDLGSWTGSGSQTVGTVTISNIQVNPSLADSLFTH
jgi:hypothetical protein